jgi:hypothetical protein
LRGDRVEIVVGADAGVLYEMVSDLERIGAWSPECERVEWEGAVTVPVEGSTFVGHNAVGPGRRIRYSRHGRVLVADRGREFAFITDEGWSRVDGLAVSVRARGWRHPDHRVLRGPLDPGVGSHS